MKKSTLLVAGVLCSLGLHAQIFTDGFEAAEGYSVNDYIGPGPNTTYWTTWSGAEGGAEDAQVTDAQANTGSNSIHFSSTAATGGPQDVLLDFGSTYTSGIFTYESAFYIVGNGNGYFNFQAVPTPGTTWTMNCNMDGGQILIDDGTTPNLAVGSYTADTWFTLRIEANLSTGVWQAFVDGNSIGCWLNGVNSIASLDLFPVQNSDFYVDDVMFDHQSYTLPNLNASAAGINMGSNIAGLNTYPEVTVVNGGTTTINSFDVTIDYNGNQYVENVTGLNLASTNAEVVLFTTPVPMVSGALPVTYTISNVNGGADDDPSDDSCGTNVDPVTPAAGKVVVGEEATGTWCQWCPRGAVFMDQYEADYGQYWAGVAVHNNDPMAVTEYDTGLGTLISGYPSSVVDRGSDVDPSAMSTDFFERIQIAPAAQMTAGATWDAGTRELNVSITAVFDQAASNSYKMLCVLTEDGVTGTDPGYNQSNAYAGGGSGVMGGYELLPNPVPASQMVYDHVARAITPSFGGDNTCFPATIAIGDSVTNNYSFTLPAGWDENEIHIIGMLVDPSGRIDNAAKEYISGAVSNGFVQACALSVIELNGEQLDDVLRVYPNPASTQATVEINIKEAADVQLRMIDMTGKEVAANDYGSIEGASTVTINTSNFESGIYIVELTVDGTVMTKRLAIK